MQRISPEIAATQENLRETLSFTSNTLKMMLEYQNSQFQVMMNSHSHLFSKLIDKLGGSESDSEE